MFRTRLPQLLRAALLTVAVMHLSACSYFHRYQEDEWGPRALLNPAQIVPKSPRAGAPIAATWSATGDRPSEYDQFYFLERQLNLPSVNKGDAAYNQLLQQYIGQGIALSNNVCDTWFNLLERAQANTQFWKNNSVIAAATATTIMGAADAAAKEIAIVAAGFAGVNSGFENFQSTFLFTPSMQTVRTQIRLSREQAVEEKFKLVGNSPKTYETAKAELLKYHQLCSGSEVKKIIEQAVDIATYRFVGQSWTTAVSNAGVVAPAPSVAIEKNTGELLFARAAAVKSFEALKPSTDPLMTAAMAKFTLARNAIDQSWEDIQANATKPGDATADKITLALAKVLELEDPVAKVTERAKALPTNKELAEASKQLSLAYTDMLLVSAKLKALYKAYAVAEGS